MLETKEIRLILKLLSEKTIIAPTLDFPYRVSQEARGYSEDPVIGALQAKLSIMLEVASKRGS